MTLLDAPTQSAKSAVQHEPASPAPLSVQIRTNKAGEQFMGQKLTEDLYQTRFFHSPAADAIRSEFVQMVHGNAAGESKAVQVRSRDSRVSEIIRSLPGHSTENPATAVNVKEIVHLGVSRAQTGTPLSDIIRAQLDHVERQLRKGHKVVVRIASPETAQIASDGVRKLLRDKELKADVRVTGNKQQKRLIAASLGSKVMLRTDAEKLSFKARTQIGKFFSRMTNAIRELLSAPGPASAPKRSSTTAAPAQEKKGTPKKNARVSSSDLHQRLQARRKSSSKPGSESRPIVITVHDGNELEATLRRLSALKSEYGPLLTVKLTPAAKEKWDVMRQSSASAPLAPTGVSSRKLVTSRGDHSSREHTGHQSSEEDKRTVNRYLRDLLRRSPLR